MVGSHHHQPGGSPLRVPAPRSEHGGLLRDAVGVLLAIGFAVHFEIVVTEDLVAVLDQESVIVFSNIMVILPSLT